MADIKYVIINASEVSNIDFSQVLQSSVDTLRYNNDRNKTLVKFTGTTPSFLTGKTQYNHSQIMAELQEDEWTEEL